MPELKLPELKVNEEQKPFLPILEKALAVELDQRFQSAQDFLLEVRRVRGAIEGGRSSNAPSRAKIWGLGAAAMLVATLLGVALWRNPHLVSPVEDSRISFSQEQTSAETLYWDLSENEKMEFIRDAADNIAKLLGENPSPLTREQIALIKKHVDAYAAKRNSLSTELGEESIKAVYARASVYAPFVIEAFRARRLPPILGLYIAMNETDYHPCKNSAVNAKGLYSFIPETAVRYGLQLAPEDERCDPLKIAVAAARYLEDLTRLFGRDADAMTLALLAYNLGENRVARAIESLKERDFHRVSFWTILENNESLSSPLNSESKNYAPRFFAAAILGENPNRFGLEIQRLSAYTTAR